MLSKILYPFWDEKCKLLTSEKNIRFAGIIDSNGNIVSGGFKEGMVPLENDEKRLLEFTKFVYWFSLRKEYDKTLGPLNYLASRRDNLVLISFPFPQTELALLVSAEKSIDIEKLASHVVHIFNKQHLRSGD